MHTIIGLLFCLLLGVMLRQQGMLALLWVPLGFAFALYTTAQIVLPIIMGLPRAIRLVSKGQMRPAVFGRIIFVPLIWLVSLFVAGVVAGFIWPSVAESLYNNLGFNLAGWLGTLAILLSALSKKARADFREDFDRAYGRFYSHTAAAQPPPLPASAIFPPFKFSCPHCGQHISTTFDTIGSEAHCPSCQNAITVPLPEA